jgi:hypothetical protein
VEPNQTIPCSLKFQLIKKQEKKRGINIITLHQSFQLPEIVFFLKKNKKKELAIINSCLE